MREWRRAQRFLFPEKERTVFSKVNLIDRAFKDLGGGEGDSRLFELAKKRKVFPLPNQSIVDDGAIYETSTTALCIIIIIIIIVNVNGG